MVWPPPKTPRDADVRLVVRGVFDHIEPRPWWPSLMAYAGEVEGSRGLQPDGTARSDEGTLLFLCASEAFPERDRRATDVLTPSTMLNHARTGLVPFACEQLPIGSVPKG